MFTVLSSWQPLYSFYHPTDGRSPIHRHYHKIYLMTCLRTIARQMVRYPKMIIRHVLSEFTELVLSDRKICHSYDMS